MRQALRALAVLLTIVLVASHGGIEQIGLFPIGAAPISAVGLAAGRPFEGWIRLAISPDPSVAGRSLPAGTTIAITFAQDFVPLPDVPRVYLLRGWPQGDLDTPYTVERSAADPRSIVVKLTGSIDAAGGQRPGLKAIHVIGGVRNPGAGTYAVHLAFSDETRSEAGDAAVTISGSPAASIAPFNAAHGGEDADFQHVSPGARAPVPFDFIINDIHGRHPEGITLAHSSSPFSLEIRQAGHVLGHLTAGGGARIEPAAATSPQTVRVRVYAPSTPGVGIVRASLEHGTGATLRIFAEST